MTNKSKIPLFLQTGGTIDKEYPQNDNNHGYNFQIGSPAFERILERAGIENYNQKAIVQKDSLDLTDEDRELIYIEVKEAETDTIIITHGTDTIEQTVKKLANIRGKTIVLTGAMKPEKFKGSDADFNIGMALGVAKYADHGVYVVLDGLIQTPVELK